MKRIKVSDAVYKRVNNFKIYNEQITNRKIGWSKFLLVLVRGVEFIQQESKKKQFGKEAIENFEKGILNA